MATKKEEMKAWKKLKEEYPNTYITLSLEYKQYDDKGEQVKYRAYIGSGKICLSSYCNTPMEAVDNVLKKIKE